MKNRQIWIHDKKMCAGNKIYDPKSAPQGNSRPKKCVQEIITQKNRPNRMFV